MNAFLSLMIPPYVREKTMRSVRVAEDLKL